MQKNTYVGWKSRWTFILAVTGSAVGLGNIWKFPYITGENGGGAFVLAYLACILLVGIPVMIAEISIGRFGRTDPHSQHYPRRPGCQNHDQMVVYRLYGRAGGLNDSDVLQRGRRLVTGLCVAECQRRLCRA